MNPSETKGSSTEEPKSKGRVCPQCGMAQSEWKGNKGQGMRKANETYCCDGCAEGGECTCS